jgi:hypothetical protein
MMHHHFIVDPARIVTPAQDRRGWAVVEHFGDTRTIVSVFLHYEDAEDYATRLNSKKD